jgi:hypothetical protein
VVCGLGVEDISAREDRADHKMESITGEHLMPGSSEKGKAFIKDWFDKQNFKTVLDVGPGWGTYSKLLKKPDQWWDCVEIHEPYIERFNLWEYYNMVFFSDILDFSRDKKYDVVIFGDVLEHMTKEQALEVLSGAKIYSDYVIISLPLDAETNAPPGTGDVDWGNIHELHLAKWSFDEFLTELEILDYDIIATERYPEIAVFIAKVR